MSVKRLEIITFLSIAFYASYMFLGIFTDVRLDRLRPFITKQAVGEGIAAGIKQYKVEEVEREPVRKTKRKIRDQIVKRYLDKIKEIMESENLD